MSAPQDPREKLQRLAQASGLELDERAWAMFAELQESVSAEAVSASSPSATDTAPAGFQADPATLRAVIADTYAVEELDGPASEALLRHSDSVLIGGQYRLRLQAQARAQVLAGLDAAADARERYRRLLATAIAGDPQQSAAIGADPVVCANVWLRCLLDGRWRDLERASVAELQGALQAATDLQFARLDRAPPDLQELRSRVELAELLEPMRLLVGSDGSADGDRFVGRSKELTRLRSHVDALASRSLLESVGRLATKVQHATFDRQPGVLVLQGRGGMGKSTLLAKFILDHVRSLHPPVPLIYLDFDRAGLQSCARRRLLLESVRQARLQSPRAAADLCEVETQIGQALLRGDGGAERQWWERLRAALAESAGAHGAVLLVLDTMEAMQAIPDALDRVIEFIDAFSSPQFPQLRIVAAGRAEIPELVAAGRLRAAGDTLPLKPLSISEARDMTERLGHDLLGQEWKTAWSVGIAGRARDKDSRREPLSLRIAVELLRAQPAQGRDVLAREIAERSTEQMGEFVGALYSRRVLSHVRDPQAQKLAWPGLVLRRIDLKLVRELLAPLCGLEADSVELTYEALAREVWIVAREGDGLRHLTDLRSRTLPLMRQFDPALFARVNDAAIDYFARRSGEDPGARAEWIYHRLLAGQSSHEVERDWHETMVIPLANAADDFDADSDQAQFLLARTARHALSPERILRLSPLRALEHIARCWPKLATLDEEKMVPLLARLDLDSAELVQIPPELRNVRFALRVKTGRWSRAGEFENEVAQWRAEAHGAHLYLLGRSLRAAGSTAWLPDMTSDPPLGAFGLQYRAVQLCQAILSLPSDDDAQESLGLDLQLGVTLRILRDTVDAWRGRLPLALRNLLGPAAARCRDALAPALSLLLHDACELPLEKRCYSAEEVRALLDADGSSDVRHELHSHVPYFSQFLNPSYASLPLRLSDPACIELLDGHLRRLLDAAAAGAARAIDIAALRRFASVRHPDCLVPVAYAAARACGSRVPVAVQEKVDMYGLEGRDRWLPSALFGRRSRTDDVMTALRLADEAGDLLDMAQTFANHASDRVAALDLEHMLYCLRLRRIMPVAREIAAVEDNGLPLSGSLSSGGEPA